MRLHIDIITLNYLPGLDIRAVFGHTVSHGHRIQIPVMILMNSNKKRQYISIGNPSLDLCTMNVERCNVLSLLALSLCVDKYMNICLTLRSIRTMS